MAQVGAGPNGYTLIATGITGSPTFAAIGSQSGLTAHGVVISEGTSAFVATAAGFNGQILISGVGVDPKFSTLTSLDGSISFTTGINALDLSVAGGTTVGKTITGNSGGALSPTAGNWNILAATVAAGTTPITTSGAVSTLTINVQKSQAIASTDATKIGLSNFNSSYFTVDANGFVSLANASGFPWTDVTGATQTLAVNNGYVTDHANVTYTLPSTAVLGDTIKIVGKVGLATITPNANQQLLFGSASGTVGATGTAVATNAGDCVELICVTSGASTVWRAANFVGNWTIN